MRKLFHVQFVIVVFLFTTVVAKAQPQHTAWFATFNTVKTGKKTSIHSDFQYRTANDLKHTQTLLLRAGLNVQATKHIVLTTGYAFIHNYRSIGDIDGYVPEHRIWEQLVYNHKFKKLLTAHRFRVEQRFMTKTVVANNELNNDGSLYANRFRYFIRNILPLNGKEQFSQGLFAALQNEIFLNFGNKQNVNGKTFDQNRLYLALGYRLNKSFDLEAGYMNQYINGRNSAFVNTHIAQLAGYIRL